jgi:hypothetical protein
VRAILASEEAQERPALLGDVVADRGPQPGMALLECAERGTLRSRNFHLQVHFGVHSGRGAERVGEDDSDYAARNAYVTDHTIAIKQGLQR